MREFWSGFFGSAAGLLTAAAVLVITGAYLAASLAGSILGAHSDSPLPPSSDQPVLIEIDLRGLDVHDDGGAGASGFAVVRALDLAGRDSRVAGVIVYVGGRTAIAPGHGEEIARGLDRLAEAGLPVIGYIENAEAGGWPVYLAVSGAGEVWASGLAGFSRHGAIGLTGPVDGASLEAVRALAEDFRGQARDLWGEPFLTDPIGAPAALEAGLIDAIDSDQHARARLASLAGAADARFLDHQTYLNLRAEPGEGAHIALVEINGFIRSGHGDSSERTGVSYAAATVDALALASGSDAVRAIIVRISASAGDAAAADQIAAAIQAAQERGKPVIAYIGSSAQGWAYHAVAPSDRIITPAAAAMGRLGDRLSRLPAAIRPRASAPQDGEGSSLEDERYAALLEGVARARDLPLARVAELGRGQVWSGAQAVDLGLADAVGGLHEALASARQLARMTPDEPAVLTAYPARPQGLRSTVSRLTRALEED